MNHSRRRWIEHGDTRLSRLALIAAAIAAVASLFPSCALDSPTGLRDTSHDIPDAIYENWSYYTLDRIMPDGTSQSMVPVGNLEFIHDGRWSMNRDVGGVRTAATGTFSVDSAKLLSIYDSSGLRDTSAFALGYSSINGAAHKSLLLTSHSSDGTKYVYTLVYP